ncbi:MAG: 16S rRNA (guanine(966)-N(2))-methyltransferase RsmD [Clostridiaceae bacterium]|nr:16S rRNA (guanine(966)-N(2))-methyltransferase RsmD [Clostridiaceae bacterium]
MPRVIAGKAGGIKLYTNQEELMRPTTDRMKEAVFASLQNDIQQGAIISFLDLFAGSGQMGIEALSRGVPNVVFIEQNRQAKITIQKNLEKTKLKAEILSLTADRAIRQLIKQEKDFDIIYFDPPWMSLNENWQELEENIQKLLSQNGKILIEHSGKLALLINETKWRIDKEKKYGLSILTILSRK